MTVAMETRRLFSVFLLAGVLCLCDANACPKIVGRSQWGARAPKTVTPMKTPVEYVIIHHTTSPKCSGATECGKVLRSIQIDHMTNRLFSDIGYSFLVSSDGNVYEGRGWNTEGAHAPGYNHRSIGISFIGDFQNEDPTQKQQNIAKDLIACGVSTGKLMDKYKLLGHRQTKATECPGNKLYNIIIKWPKWLAKP